MSQAGGDGDGNGLEFPASFKMKVNEWKFRVNHMLTKILFLQMGTVPDSRGKV
jgi:hypothetical protein